MRLEGEIHSPSRRFALHPFGHMHEPELTTVTLGGADAAVDYRAARWLLWRGGMSSKVVSGYTATQSVNRTLQLPRCVFSLPGRTKDKAAVGRWTAT